MISAEEDFEVRLALAKEVENLFGSMVEEKLLSYAIDKLDTKRLISVVTFDETVEEGMPAPGIYSKYRFIDKERNGNNPAGRAIVLMTLSKHKN